MANKQEWRLGLAYVDYLRKDAVRRQDAEQARELVRLACLMARAEVNTGVELSERYFHAYVTDGEILNSFHADSWASIEEWVKGTDCLALLASNPWQVWEQIMAEVKGLGPTKAAMACALMGFPQIGCIDRHMAAGLAGVPLLSTDGKKANPAAEKAYKDMTSSPKRYRASHALAFAGKRKPRDAQWTAFWNLKDEGTKGKPGAEFRRSAHMPYFAAVIEAHNA